jgi:hypothetical protein
VRLSNELNFTHVCRIKGGVTKQSVCPEKFRGPKYFSFEEHHFPGHCTMYEESEERAISVFNVRFEVFTAVTMKNGVFWVVTPCGSCKNRCFGGTWCLLHQGDKNR